MIEVQGLVTTFPGAKEPVLRGVTLSVAEGEVFGVIGRSGAGKSRLVRCLDLLETPTAGVVRIGGREVSSLHVVQGIQNIGDRVAKRLDRRRIRRAD